MAALVIGVIMKKRNATRGGPIPAAQYIRMSTEHQRFSPDNQKAVMAAYAAEHGFEVIATYQDSGKSGLTLSGRPELKRLLSDVLSGAIQFEAILVLDVSRWGRFQDADQSAHYEYMCREAGAPVQYCSEAFANDGGTMASIVKHMKRVMAAEYSRDLSKRVARAQRQQAKLGFKQGGQAVLGVRRQVVDERGSVRMTLSAGQRKALSTDKVVYIPGPASELAQVQRIFRMYVSDDLRISEICAQLTKEGACQPNGREWSYATIRRLLCNEIYLGTYVFGRRRNNLGDRKAAPPADWIRTPMLAPIVEPRIFAAALDRAERTTRRRYSDDQLLEGLRRLLAETGLLTAELVRACPYLPTPEVLVKRFGSVAHAFRQIGYERPAGWRQAAIVERYTQDEALDELRRIYAQEGYLSRRGIDRDSGTPGARYFARRFGSLKAAYELAGVPTTPGAQHVARSDPRRAGPLAGRLRKQSRGRNPDGSLLSNEQFLDHLRRLLSEHGYLTDELIDADLAAPTTWLFRKHFGSLPIAYGMVGFFTSHSAIVQAAFDRRKARDFARGAENVARDQQARSDKPFLAPPAEPGRPTWLVVD
ncbi:MAG: hypothetical protein JWR80_8528 [Bradyrhizobium sp.]|nr:hypothetical protein [Bradyrhizobium sp.]